MVLLVIANLGDEAYGLAIKNYIRDYCHRSVSISTVHATIHRLEKKGFLSSKYDGSRSGERGGRPKLIFSVTSTGRSALETTKELRNTLWSTMPKLSFSSLFS